MSHRLKKKRDFKSEIELGITFSQGYRWPRKAKTFVAGQALDGHQLHRHQATPRPSLLPVLSQLPHRPAPPSAPRPSTTHNPIPLLQMPHQDVVNIYLVISHTYGQPVADYSGLERKKMTFSSNVESLTSKIA